MLDRLDHRSRCTEAVADGLLQDALDQGQTVRFRNLSESMLPTIRPGDVVLMSGERPELGDIALARWRGGWVAHRVVQETPSGVLLRADNGGAEHLVRSDEIRGRVVEVRRDLRSRLWRGLRRLTSMMRHVSGAAAKRRSKGPRGSAE